MYILDANALIDGNRDYYPIDRFPEFWDWLVSMGQRGLVKVPQEVYDKVTQVDDALSRWLRANREGVLLNEAVDEDLIIRVINEGYASDLTDVETEKLNEDPFLIAYALVEPEHRRVVSTERSRPNATRANRKVPDVCDDFGIRCYHIFLFIRELDFHTDWRTRQ